MPNRPYENKFDLNENEPIGGMHSHMSGFAQRLVSTQAKGNLKMAYCSLNLGPRWNLPYT